MKAGLIAGLSREEHFVATKELSVEIGKATVLSTPSLVRLMERTSRLILDQFLTENEASVGASIQMKHLAPTPIGAEVRVVSRVAAVSGRRVDFSIEAYDSLEKIGEATHQRFVVELKKFQSRVDEKLRH